jgi:hypothetical protein
MTTGLSPRARRLRAPLLVGLAVLLGFETIGGLVIFCFRLANGTLPGETIHVLAGVALTVVYAEYQRRHWLRVGSLRAPLDRVMGFLAAGFMIVTLIAGLVLGWQWWRHRTSGSASEVEYAPLLSAVHNIATLLVVGFVAAHVGAVLQRDAGRNRGPGGPGA